jgi:hypothetical protein
MHYYNKESDRAMNEQGLTLVDVSAVLQGFEAAMQIQVQWPWRSQYSFTKREER